MSTEPRQMDPYRLLFPFGWALGLLGALIWLLFYLSGKGAYPGPLHAGVMMGGFQLVFAAGFLMTAIPRFTGTSPATRPELALATALSGLILAVSLIAVAQPEAGAWLPAAIFLLSGFLCVYFFRRFIHRTHSPPPSFTFVGAALLFAILGNLAIALASHLPAAVLILGRLVFFHGMMLSLVLGVGSRLVTANLGWMQNPIIQISRQTRETKPLDFVRSSYGTSLLLTIVFVASFLIEALADARAGKILRAVVATFVIHPQWRLYRLPRTRTKMSLGLWISAWSVFLGLWAYALSPSYLTVASAHLMFISGFGLMIFMIAGRVTLSHGGFDISIEAVSRIYPALVVLMVVSAIARVVAGLMPADQTPNWLIAAAVFFIFALLVWASMFLGKVIRPKFVRSAKRAAP